MQKERSPFAREKVVKGDRSARCQKERSPIFFARLSLLVVVVTIAVAIAVITIVIVATATRCPHVRIQVKKVADPTLVWQGSKE